jgi:hypothetical protein
MKLNTSLYVKVGHILIGQKNKWAYKDTLKYETIIDKSKNRNEIIQPQTSESICRLD